MDSIFVLTETNFDFFRKDPESACRERIGDSSHWKIRGRICYHFGDPHFIEHNHVILHTPADYDDYYHFKPLYAVSHYSLAELKDIATRLCLPHGKKQVMYDSISDYIKNHPPK